MQATYFPLRSLFIIGISGIVTLYAIWPAYADEWTMRPSLRLGYEYNDNIDMTLQPHNSVTGETVAPRIDAGVRSDVWSVNGTAEIARKNYSGEQGLDRNDQTFSLLSQYMGERSTFSINASRIDDSVISGQLLDPDIGLTSFQKKRDTKAVNPAWTWSMTELTQARLEYQLSQVSYVDGKSVGLNDYVTRTAAVTLTHELSPQDQFSIIAAYSYFRVPSLDLTLQVPRDRYIGGFIPAVTAVESKTPTLKISGTHVFSDTFSGIMSLGARRTSTKQDIQTCTALFHELFPGFNVFDGYDCALVPSGPFVMPASSQVIHDTGITYSGSLNKKFQELNLYFAINRDLSASGAGTQVIADSISMRADRSVTARLKSFLYADGYTAKTLVNISNANINRRAYSLRPGLQWQWTEECNLSLAYNYSHLKRENEPRIVQSHSVSATLIYAWQKLSFSR